MRDRPERRTGCEGRETRAGLFVLAVNVCEYEQPAYNDIVGFGLTQCAAVQSCGYHGNVVRTAAIVGELHELGAGRRRRGEPSANGRDLVRPNEPVQSV